MTGAITSVAVRLLCIGGLVLSVGCSSQPTPTRYYLLTDPAPVSAAAPTATVALELGEVMLPVYLQSRSMAVVAGDTEVRSARGHRWAEPLTDGVQRFLEDALATNFSSEAGYLLDVVVRHLHGSEAGLVYLDLNWRIRKRGSDAALRAGRFNESEPQGAPGYESMVLAHRALLARFARYIEGVAGGLANQKQAAPSTEAAAMSEKPSS